MHADPEEARGGDALPGWYSASPEQGTRSDTGFVQPVFIPCDDLRFEIWLCQWTGT